MLRYDGPVYRFFVWMSRLAYLNLLFILTSIPIFTILPAAAAMSSIASRWVRGEHPALFRNYLAEFKRHFTQSFLLGIFFLLPMAVVLGDYKAALLAKQRFYWFFASASMGGFLLLMTLSYATVLLVRLNLTMKDVLSTAFRLGAYKIHITLLHLLTVIALVFLGLHFSFLDAFFIFSGIAYVNAWYTEYKLRDVVELRSNLAGISDAKVTNIKIF